MRLQRSASAVAIAISSCALVSCTILLGGDLDDLESGTNTPGPLPSEAGTIDTGAADADAGVDAAMPTPRACSDLPAGAKSGIVEIDPDGSGAAAPFRVYCDVDDAPRKWTLALKIDGTRDDFKYDAARWTDESTLNPDKPNFDAEQAKLASFSTVPFTEIRAGMRDETGRLRWLVVPIAGTSLRALFAGAPSPLSLGRDAWKSLLPLDGQRLQINCNREGVNMMTEPAAMRLGIIGNNENTCFTTDSYLGFGGFDLTVGSFCFGGGGDSCPNGPGSTPAFGYLMIR